MFKILPIFFLRSGFFNCLFRYFTGYAIYSFFRTERQKLQKYGKTLLKTRKKYQAKPFKHTPLLPTQKLFFLIHIPE